uniref:Uncharacterized protein n=1 Tax=Lactuca sativa TaxID=4236 RepID=A0A9R1WIL2_LACSA|nr:hypothetical protein LSAT_V11C200069330 [Lactuca sativa]
MTMAADTEDFEMISQIPFLTKYKGETLNNIDHEAMAVDPALVLTIQPPFRGGNRQKIQEKIVKDKIKLQGFLSSEAHSLLKGLCNLRGSILVGLEFLLLAWHSLAMLPILAGAAAAFGCFTLYHNGWCLSCYAIWPDLCIASYKSLIGFLLCLNLNNYHGNLQQ